MPVSYTHLDVYKRQALLDARAFDGGIPEQQEVRSLLASLPETVRVHPDAVDEVATVLRAVLVA